MVESKETGAVAVATRRVNWAGANWDMTALELRLEDGVAQVDRVHLVHETYATEAWVESDSVSAFFDHNNRVTAE